MADDIVKIELGAVDNASPTLRRVLRDVENLQAAMAKQFAPARFDMFGTKATAGMARMRDGLASVEAKARQATATQLDSERKVASEREKTAADQKREAKSEMMGTGAVLRLRRKMVSAEADSFAESARCFRYLSRVKAASTRAERQESDKAAKAEASRATDQAKRDRDTYRMRARFLRSQNADQRRVDREAERESGRSAARRSRMAGAGRDAADRVVTTGGRAGLVMAGGAALAARKILGVETDTDAAEIDLRAASGMTAAAARELRTTWAATMSESLGSTEGDVLRGFTEAIKVGIPDAGAKRFVEISKQASEAWSLPSDVVVDALGQLNSIQTAAGEAFDADKLKGVTNTLTALSDQMSTTPDRMLSFMRKGAGASQLLGMHQDLGLAFGAASTSLGNEAGASGRMFDFVAGRAIDMPRLTRKKGEDGDRARATVKALGFASGADLDRKRRADPDNFVFDLIQRFSKIKDAKKRDAAIQYFAGQEWLGEFGRLVTGSATVQEAKKIALEARHLDALGKRWELHKQKLGFVSKQIGAGLNNVLGEFGMAIAPAARLFGDAFLRWSQALRSGGIGAVFSRGLDGLVEGFIGQPLEKALAGFKPGAINADAFFSTAKGFATGLRTVADAVTGAFRAIGSALSMFGIDTKFAEGLAKFTAEFLGFATAAFILKPALAILKSFGSLLRTVAEVAGPGRLGLAVTGLSRLLGPLSALIALAATASKFSIFKDGGGGLEGVFRFLDPGLANRLVGQQKDENGNRPADDSEGVTGWLGRHLRDLVRPPQLFQRQSDRGDDTRASLLHPAAFRDFTDPLCNMRNDFRTMGAKLQLASFGTTSTAASTAVGGVARAVSDLMAPTVSARAGNSPVNSFGLTRRGIIGGAGGGAGGSAPSGFLDNIARAEGTAGRGDYDAVFGYGKWGQPGKPLSSMSLAEIQKFGQSMRMRQVAEGTAWGSTSSASGRYQITGSTMMDAARALKMDPNTTLFNGATQDAMAGWIARRQGLGAWEGFKSHPGERAAAASALAAGATGGSAGMAPPGSPGRAVDLANSLMGLNSHGAATALRSKMTNGQWCADFVNGVFAKAGIAGTGSSASQSFKTWGNAVQKLTDVKKGDVIVESHGGGKGHVGLANGELRRDRFGNITGVGMVSGNHGDAVRGNYWESPGKIAALRRAIEPNADKIASDVASPSAANIAAGITSANEPSIHARSGGAAAANGRGNTYVTQHIQGGTNDPEAIANKVQRRVGESVNWRVHDVESI